MQRCHLPILFPFGLFPFCDGAFTSCSSVRAAAAAAASASWRRCSSARSRCRNSSRGSFTSARSASRVAYEGERSGIWLGKTLRVYMQVVSCWKEHTNACKSTQPATVHENQLTNLYNKRNDEGEGGGRREREKEKEKGKGRRW